VAKLDQFKNTIGVLGLFIVPLTLLYWLFVLHFDVYQYALVGVIYELLWLPMLACLHIYPVLSLSAWIMDRFSLRSWHLYALLPMLALLLYIYFFYENS
jgi:hypothetical protein